MTQSVKSSQSNSVKGFLNQNSSLGRDRHAPQVAPDRHQATMRTNQVKRIGTWNVRTLYQQGKLDNVKKEMKRMKVDILGMAEVRWTGAGSFKSDGYTMIYSGGQNHERGVGILFSQASARSLMGYWPISDRVLLSKLNARPLNMNIIQVYAPRSNSSEEEIEKFHEDMETAKKQCKSQEVTIIMGDFKVGNKREDSTLGPHGLGERNERGERLAEWCRNNDFMVGKTWLENHPRRLWTRKMPNERARNHRLYLDI